MPVSFACPHCGVVTEVAEQYVGKSGPCKGCGKSVTVPPPAGALAPSSAEKSKSTGGTLLVIAVAAAGAILVVGAIMLALLGDRQ